MGTSGQVFAACSRASEDDEQVAGGRVPMKLVVTNANAAPAKLRITLGGSAAKVAAIKGTRIKDGARIYEATVPAQGRRELTWTIVDD